MSGSDAILELHGARTGNCLRAAVALAEAGLEFSVRRISLRDSEHRSPSHLALNPRGKVPVLVVQDRACRVVLTQSNAIMFFAANRSSSLLPADVPERHRVLDAFFHFATDIVCVNNAAFRLERAGESSGSSFLAEEFLASIAASETLLSTAGYMGGGAFSLADISAYTVIDSVADKLPWHGLPRLRDWHEKIAARPLVREGMSAFG